MRNAWALLDLEPGSDRAAIRRAYARKLKVTNPEDDPKGFMALREAYEWLLGHVEYAAHDLDEFRGGEAGEHRFDPGQLDAVVAEPAKPAAAPERDPELDRLDALLTRLAANLAQGGTDGRLLSRELLADILASPAMLSLAVAARVEQALATMIAQNVPSSDAIILPALDAFDWTDQRRAHQYPYAEIIARLDEWRIIQALDHPSDPSHKAWQALVKLAPSPLRWLQARTRRRRDIADLLDFIEYQCPGVAYSASREALDWWRQELAHDRQTVEPWALRVGIAVGLFLLLIGVKVERLNAAVATLSFFALTAADRLASRRFIRPRWTFAPGCQEAGLLGAMLALPICAALLPIGWWTTAAIGVAAVALVWTLRWTTGPQPDEPLRAATSPAIALGFSAMVLALTDMPLPLSGMMMLAAIAWMLFGQGLQLRVRMVSLIENVTGKFTWPLTVVAALGLLYLAFTRRGDPTDMAVHMIAIVLAVYAINGISLMLQRPPPSIILGGMMIASAFLMLTATMTVSDPVTKNDATAGEAILAARAQHSGSTYELPERQAQQSLDAMRSNNPELLAAIDRIVTDNDNVFDRDKAAEKVEKLLDSAMRDRLLKGPDKLIADEQRLREQILTHWRGKNVLICANELRADATIPLATSSELRRIRLAVASAPIVEHQDDQAKLTQVAAELPKRKAEALKYAQTLRVPFGGKPKWVSECNDRLATARALASFDDDQIGAARRAAASAAR